MQVIPVLAAGLEGWCLCYSCLEEGGAFPIPTRLSCPETMLPSQGHGHDLAAHLLPSGCYGLLAVLPSSPHIPISPSVHLLKAQAWPSTYSVPSVPFPCFQNENSSHNCGLMAIKPGRLEPSPTPPSALLRHSSQSLRPCFRSASKLNAILGSLLCSG